MAGCEVRNWKAPTLSFPSLKRILGLGTTGPEYVRLVGKLQYRFKFGVRIHFPTTYHCDTRLKRTYSCQTSSPPFLIVSKHFDSIPSVYEAAIRFHAVSHTSPNFPIGGEWFTCSYRSRLLAHDISPQAFGGPRAIKTSSWKQRIVARNQTRTIL